MIRRSSSARVGFTLIEILVVIAIIGVLAALITGAVMRVSIVTQDAGTRHEISDLATSLALFNKDFKVWPPSRLYLSPNPNDYKTTPLGKETLKNLLRVWPRLGTPSTTPEVYISGFASGIGLNAPILLEGDQCLVLFLQGLTGTGFSSDPGNPLAPGGTRKGPYYTFPQNKLKQLHGNAFPSFVDGFDKDRPYLYFCTYTKMNGYHLSSTDTGDCPTGGGTGVAVAPYYKSVNPPVFYQPDSFQIVSAGRDGVFFAGGAWAPGSGQGGDDFTNFAGGMLKAE